MAIIIQRRSSNPALTPEKNDIYRNVKKNNQYFEKEEEAILFFAVF